LQGCTNQEKTSQKSTLNKIFAMANLVILSSLLGPPQKVK